MSSSEQPPPSTPSLSATRRITVRLCGMSCSICGYCGGKRAGLVHRAPHESSKSYGLLVSHLSTASYNALLYRGWRRSGLHLYKPDNSDSCCPALTIRLKVNDFVATKSQKRVLKKMSRALNLGTNHSFPVSTGKISAPMKANGHNQTNCQGNGAKSSRTEASTDLPFLQQLSEWTKQALVEALNLTENHRITIPQVKYKVMRQIRNTTTRVTAVSTVCAAIAGPSKGKIDKGLLSDEIVKRLQPRGLHVESHRKSGQIICTLNLQQQQPTTNGSRPPAPMEVDQTSNQRDDWFQANNLSAAPLDLSITTLPALESSLQCDVHQLYFCYQQKVHNDPSPLEDHEQADWGDASAGYVQSVQAMIRSTYPRFSPDKESKMASAISSFYRFLVESPLPATTDGDNRQGTFHQHYRINGILIAVGVVDILPEGLSSVYAFYHPDFAHTICPLGKFMILKEIEYCQTHNLPYYYLGYYIHSCQKMKYKADYHPSELLCPYTYKWVPAAKARSMIDESPRDCCQLYNDPEERRNDVEKKTTPTDIEESVLLDVGLPNLVTVNMLHPNGQGVVRPLVHEFVQQVGAIVSRECVLKLV